MFCRESEGGPWHGLSKIERPLSLSRVIHQARRTATGVMGIMRSRSTTVEVEPSQRLTNHPFLITEFAEISAL